jgi:DNA-binding XRE family transcriptional regulator
MTLQRIQRKIHRTPVEREEIRHLRARFKKDKPSAEDLLKSGEVEEFVSLGSFLNLQETLHTLKKLRKKLGLSLSDLAKVSKIDKAALSRLENGLQTNPKLNTLERYAAALRAKIVLSVRKASG